MKKVVVLFSVMLFFSGMATGGTYEKKALLIGVGQYKNADDEGLKNLNGPKNDVKLIKEEFLKPVLGYTEDQIDVLVDSDATRKNIVNKMNAFIKGKNVKERFFYFSGHGGQTDDISGDEEYDALDEVILPHDAAYKSDGSWDDRTIISDDDIRQWFEKLSGKKLTAMFDSCHSGTVCRSMGNLQGVPVSTPKHAFSKTGKISVKRGIPNEEELSEGEKIPEGHVYFYAALDSQAALEGKNSDNTFTGFYTEALIRTVRDIARQKQDKEKISYLKLFDSLITVMKDRMNLDQTPDIQPKYLGEEPEEYRNTRSARLIEPFFPASQAEAEGSSFPDVDRHKINVLLVQEGKNLVSPSDLKQMENHAVIDFEKKDKSYNLYINILTASKKAELTNENGYRVNLFSYSDKKDLIRNLVKRAQHEFLKDILEQIRSEHGFPMSVKVKDYDKNDFYCGQEITYMIESNVDAYVYILSVDAGGEFNLLLPFELQTDNKIRKGGRILLPDQEICGHDIVMEITDEPGEEIIKVLASPTPLNIKMAKPRIMESEDDYMTQISFDEALKTIRDMIAQLRKQDIWYEGTKKYMNHTRQEYDSKFR